MPKLCNAILMLYVLLESTTLMLISWVGIEGCLSVCIFGMPITQQCLHPSKQGILEMKAVPLKNTKFIFTSLYRTHCSSTGVHKRQWYKQPLTRNSGRVRVPFYMFFCSKLNVFLISRHYGANNEFQLNTV